MERSSLSTTKPDFDERCAHGVRPCTPREPDQLTAGPLARSRPCRLPAHPKPGAPWGARHVAWTADPASWVGGATVSRFLRARGGWAAGRRPPRARRPSALHGRVADRRARSGGARRCRGRRWYRGASLWGWSVIGGLVGTNLGGAVERQAAREHRMPRHHGMGVVGRHVQCLTAA